MNKWEECKNCWNRHEDKDAPMCSFCIEEMKRMLDEQKIKHKTPYTKCGFCKMDDMICIPICCNCQSELSIGYGK